MSSQRRLTRQSIKESDAVESRRQFNERCAASDNNGTDNDDDTNPLVAVENTNGLSLDRCSSSDSSSIRKKSGSPNNRGNRKRLRKLVEPKSTNRVMNVEDSPKDSYLEDDIDSNTDEGTGNLKSGYDFNVDDSGDDNRIRSQNSTSTIRSTSSLLSIPKKKSSIPRRKADSYTTVSSSSLLANMKPKQAHVEVPLFKQQGPPQGYSKSKNQTSLGLPAQPKISEAPLNQSHQQGQFTKRKIFASQDLHQARSQTEQFSSPDATTRTLPTSQLVGLKLSQSHLMANLEKLCDALSGDIRFKTEPSTSIDLSGSFLSSNYKGDFLDSNEQGETVFLSNIPIFPEEFPPEMKEHSLSWWGIMDPAIGDGKFGSTSSYQSQFGNGFRQLQTSETPTESSRLRSPHSQSSRDTSLNQKGAPPTWNTLPSNRQSGREDATNRRYTPPNLRNTPPILRSYEL